MLLPLALALSQAFAAPATAAAPASPVTVTAPTAATAPTAPLHFFVLEVTRTTSGAAGPVTAAVGMAVEATRTTRPVTAPTLAAATTSATGVTAATVQYLPVVNFAGFLKERGTRRPIADAQVVLAELGMAAFTDRQGYFEFEDVPAGDYTVVAPVVGYERLKTTESISETERTDVTYYIEPLAGSPLEVIVEVDRVRKEVSKTVLNRVEVSQVAGTGGDAVKVITTLPGVATSNELGTDLLVRGSGPFDNRIEIDRIQVPFVYHFGGLRSVLHEDLIDGVDFQAGGFSANFGRATGGVLLARTRPGTTEQYRGAVDVNTLLSEAYVEGPIGEKGSFLAAGRRSYIDVIVGPVVEELVPPEELTFNVFPQFYDYQLRFDYRLTTDATVNAFVFGADDVLQLLVGRVDPRDPGVTGSFYVHPYFHVQSVGYTQKWGRITNKTNVYYLTQGQDIRIGSDGGFLAILLQAPGLNNDTSVPLGERQTINFGTQLRFDRATFRSRFPRPPRPGESDFTFTDAELVDYERVINGGQVGFYVDDVVQVTDSWMLVPGVRFDYYKQDRGYFYADPRISTRWSVRESTTLKAAVGRYSDFPSEQQLDGEFGNTLLEPFHGIHYVAGVEHQLTDSDFVDIQAYYKTLEGLVYQNPLAGGQYQNVLDGKGYGFEIFYRHYLTSRLFGWASYAYARSFRRYPQTGRWEPSSYDQPHIVNLVANYKLSNRWTVGSRWRYNSGEPYTPLVDRIFVADKGFYIPVSGERNSLRRPAQHRMDARVSYGYPFNTWTLETYLEVLNLYGYENVADYSNNYDYTEREAFSLLPVPVPVLGIRAEF